MATDTLHYHLKKPASADRVAIGDLNDNADTIDGYLYKANERADQMADDYNASETYNTGDYVRRENYLYKCNTDNTTGTWDDTKWDRVKVMDEITQGGGGGSSTLVGLNDVNISSPTDGQALVYDYATSKWVNGAGGGGSSTLAGLSDVSVTGVANKDIIRYNSTSQKYEKSSALTDLELAVSQISASSLGITNGHTIVDSSGTDMTQRDDLQFIDAHLTDDSVNGKTVVEIAKPVTEAEWATATEEGFYLRTEKADTVIDISQVSNADASNLPYSSTQSTKDKIDEVDAKKIRTFTYPLVVEKQCNANTTWITFSFNVSKGDIYVISGASTATSGAFTRNITGSVSGTIVNDAINHANVNNAKMWGFFEAQNDEVITYTSYTNTATTFKGVGITITQET